MAGSGLPKTGDVEINRSGGKNFTSLGSIPDSVLQGMQGTCVTIIDEEMVFVAGGMQSKSQTGPHTGDQTSSL